MDLLLHFKVNEGDENNINIQEYMLYGDVETKSEKCLVDEGDEVVLTEFPVPEFKNCTLMKKGDEGFYEYKDYRQGENAELAGGYAVSGILQQNKRFDFNYVNDQINGIVQDPFYKVETMGDYQIPMRVLDAYNDLYMAALATTEYIYYLHDSDDVLMVGLENRQTIARGEFAMDSYQESFENIYYGNSYEEEIWLCKDEWEHDLYSSNEYSLTDAGKTKVKHFIEDCRIKQDSILKAGLDTAKETTLPSVEDILCNVEDMVDEDGKYTNAWNITDNYLSDPLELNKDDDFVIHSNEQVKDVLIPLPLVVKETPLPPSYEVSTSQPHYTEVNLFDVSDDVCHEEDTNDFSPWSDRSINNILRIGSGFVNGKYRIYHLYTAMNVNAKDKATYLKNEYGIGGRTYDFKNKKQDKGYIDHDSKGLTICVSSKDSASLFKDSESKNILVGRC